MSAWRHQEKSVDKDGKEVKSRLSPGDNFQMPQRAP